MTARRARERRREKAEEAMLTPRERLKRSIEALRRMLTTPVPEHLWFPPEKP